MSQQVQDRFLLAPLTRIAYLATALVTVAVGQIWVYWHPIELVMDIAAPCMFLFLALARCWRDVFVKLSVASAIVLVVAMLAAAKWMTIPA